MSLAESNDAESDRDPRSISVGSRRYSILDLLSQGPRAELLIGVAAGAASLEELVLIKRFRSEVVTTDWMWLVPELELARRLSHRNIVRTIDAELEPGRCVMINEYVEGAPLMACLDWSDAVHSRFPNAAIAHILLALLDAVKHARREAHSPLNRLLAHAPVAAEDVFITYTGQVKVLGFKSAPQSSREDSGPPRRLAVDLLLERQRNPELEVLLRDLPAEARAFKGDSGERLRPALQLTQREGSPGDGRVLLARLMRNALRQAHASQALRLVAAFAALQRTDAQGTPRPKAEDAPAASGVRRAGARNVQSLR